MAEIVNLNPPILSTSYFYSSRRSQLGLGPHNWNCLQQKVKSNGSRFICLFSHNNNNNNNREEQARKALEGALSGKKNEYEKWDKEIKRREELGGGGDTGGGGWFGWGGQFGWSNDDNFWQESKQASLTILGIILMYLLVAKGDLILAIVFNPLLYALRSVRNGFGIVTSKVLKKTTINQPDFDGFLKKEDYQHASAKENVIRKWGSD